MSTIKDILQQVNAFVTITTMMMAQMVSAKSAPINAQLAQVQM